MNFCTSKFTGFLRIFIVLTAYLFLASGCIRKNANHSRNPYNLDLVQTAEEYNRMVTNDPNMQMVDLEKTVKGIKLDIRYATSNNFTGAVIYTAPKAYVRKQVAGALRKVQDSLSHFRLGLKIWDAYRPYAATLRFAEIYADTNFVANPRKGSRHNRGCAVDLTLIELSTGRELPMPTNFDDFSPKAHPDYANLPDTILTNRKFLFDIMSHFGFSHYPTEWWHFDFNGWDKYKLMDLSFEELNK